jgi:RNA polymerase sigma-70 factor (ECF subfamily)
MLGRHGTLDGFESFVADTGERVRRALVAFYGVEVGTEAAAEAMTVAWQRWDEIAAMENPGGYLFRIGQSRARPHVRWRARRADFPSADPGSVSDDAAVLDLLRCMASLPHAQRACVLLVKSYGFAYREVADLLGITEAAVTNHVHRGLLRLRSMMEVHP